VLAPIRQWDRYGDLDNACIEVLDEIVAGGGAEVVASCIWRTVVELPAMPRDPVVDACAVSGQYLGDLGHTHPSVRRRS
jgi:hypothetical protein